MNFLVFGKDCHAFGKKFPVPGKIPIILTGENVFRLTQCDQVIQCPAESLPFWAKDNLKGLPVSFNDPVDAFQIPTILI